MGRAAAHLAAVCLPRAFSLWAFYALNKTQFHAESTK